MLHRRCWPGLWLLTALLVTLVSSASVFAQPGLESDARSFSRGWLQEHARKLAGRDYEPKAMAEDNPLRSLSYDDYRRIVFDPDAAIWGDEARPFHLQLFHPGFLHTEPVGIYLVDDGMAQRLTFTTDVFDYHDRAIDIDEIEAGGYAGFRVHHPINTPDRYEEFLVFLGASYFRAVAKGQFYGISARGLAVNTVGEGDEEFPRFSDFWIERPGSEAEHIIIHALLDSPSVTGAYQFTVLPGEPTRMEVEASLYPRQNIEHVGIAPLTSMFKFNATNRAGFDDYRNAVHDSDGLQILQANGEQIWRPLLNPTQVEASAFGATTEMPAGFGLLQRRQGFERFNDAEARYDKRPSLWIEPLDDWGSGRIELVEIPTSDEFHDNIVAYWQPSKPLEAGRQYHYHYRMHWGLGSPVAPHHGRVIDTAIGSEVGSEERLFVIDYSDGEQIPDLTSDPEAVRVRADTSAGEITYAGGTLLDATGHYRAHVQLDPGEASLAELRVTLEVDGEPWGETWLYRWTQ